LSSQVAVERLAEVEKRSAWLRKELGLIDLVLMQILYVVGSSWVGTAAKLGTSHTVFWLLAIASFYLPQAAVVIFLSRMMPLEGGVYQWTTIALGKFAGFMVAWNLWAYAVLIIATFGVTIATNASYLLTGATASLSGVWWYTPIVSTIALLFVTGISILGLRTGRWVHDVGGVAYLALFAIPIFGVASLARRPSTLLRAGAVCGFAVTLLYSTLSVFPIIDAASWQIFAAKIIVVIVGANLLGVAIYTIGRRAGTISSK
jgi:amino acid transporter